MGVGVLARQQRQIERPGRDVPSDECEDLFRRESATALREVMQYAARVMHRFRFVTCGDYQVRRIIPRGCGRLVSQAR